MTASVPNIHGGKRTIWAAATVLGCIVLVFLLLGGIVIFGTSAPSG